MVSVGDVPEVVYTNDKIIDRVFKYLNEGDVQEVVERSLESDTTNKGGGLSKILQLKYDKSSTGEEERELTRQLGTIGKFAVLHGWLQQEEDIKSFDEISESDRSDIEANDFIQVTGKIDPSPINDLQETVDEIMGYVNLLGMDMEFEERGQDLTLSDVQDFVAELNSGENHYTVDPSAASTDADVVFSMGDKSLDSELSEYSEYHVLGRIEYVYEKGEEDWLINLIDMMPGNGRNARQNRRQFLKQMASGSSDLLGRDISEDDFKSTYPDIRVRPVAIYLA